MGQTVTEYKVVDAPSAYRLSELVGGYVANGWVPQGGVFVIVRGMGEVLYQAIVRYG